MSASPEEEAKDQENEGEKPELFTQFWMRFEAASKIYQDAEAKRLEDIIFEQRDAAYWQGYSDARAGQQRPRARLCHGVPGAGGAAEEGPGGAAVC